MSTSRHINKFCVAAIVISFVLTLLFLNGAAYGMASTGRVMGYEGRLFETSSVHTIDIVMDDWDEFIETCENEEYSPCAVVIDGESYRNIGIRAKGNTSLSSVRSLGSQRYSFKLEFDQYENGKSYHGLDKLSLNNLIQDNTMMKDYLVYQLMGDFGVDAPLCSFAYITVNGEDWGLYLAVEGVEDGFLQRNYGSDSGELYKPDSMSFGGGRGNGRDFNFDDFDFDDMDSWKKPGNNQDSEGDTSDDWLQAPGNGTFSGGGFPGGMPQLPDGITSDGSMPQLPDGITSDGNMPQLPDGITSNGNMPQMPDGFAGDSESSQERPGGDNQFSGQPGGGFGGFGGMGSDDVKLKYIDDDADSYSNIFNNAKTEITDTDKQRLVAALKDLSEYTDLENTVDTDEVLRYFVVHNFVCNGDSYTGAMIHNYYLHELDGQLGMIPWDYNLAFGTFQSGDAASSVNASIDNPVSGGSVDDRPMLGWIFSDEAYTQKYHKLFSEFTDRWFSDGQLVQLIEETQTLISPFVEKDPTKFCTVEEFHTGVETIETFVTLRAEAVNRQLSGDTTAVETEGLNLSDMGSMGGMMGGGPGAGAGGFPGKDDNSESGSFPGKDGSSETGNFPRENGNSESGSFPGKDGNSGAGQNREFPENPGKDINGSAPGKSTNGGVLLGVSVVVLFIGILVGIKIKGYN